jgi:hypothetical protein
MLSGSQNRERTKLTFYGYQANFGISATFIMAKDKNIIYRGPIRYHTPDYAYRIIVEKRGKEIIICHYSLKHNDTTHSIGLKKKDLQRILENL